MKLGLDESDLIELLSRAKNMRIVVLGDVGVDRYTIGIVERVSPEAPVPIVAVREENLKLGLAANVADNVVALGGVPVLVGVIGADSDAKDLIHLLKKRKIDGHLLAVDAARRTILKERIVAETQQLLRIDFEDQHPIATKALKKVESNILSAIKNADAVIIEDYAKGLLSPALIQKTIHAAKKAGIPVLVDPHRKTKIESYKGATLIKPNKREAEFLCGFRITTPATLLKAGQDLMKKASLSSLVITLGKEGMAIFESPKSKPVVIPTSAREVYDVSGAGDTAISVLALMLSTGANLVNAARVANIAAGVEVGKRGTATVSPDEILKAFHEHK